MSRSVQGVLRRYSMIYSKSDTELVITAHQSGSTFVSARSSLSEHFYDIRDLTADGGIEEIHEAIRKVNPAFDPSAENTDAKCCRCETVHFPGQYKCQNCFTVLG